jgi:hypothetical protein
MARRWTCLHVDTNHADRMPHIKFAVSVMVTPMETRALTKNNVQKGDKYWQVVILKCTRLAWGHIKGWWDDFVCEIKRDLAE